MSDSDLDMTEIVKQFNRAFDTEAGKVVLEYLKERYIELSCLSDSSERTHYFLGQKELAQHILQLATDDYSGASTEIITGGDLDE